MSKTTNTRTGEFPILAAAALTGLENRLVKIVNVSDVPKADLPSAIGDLALYVVADGSAAGALSTIRPLHANQQERLKLKGTCVAGDILVNADPATSGDAGKVRKLPTAQGTYRGIAIAEETGEDGQLVACRPAMLGNITVAGT